MQFSRRETYGKNSYDDVDDPAEALFYSMPQDYQDDWKDLRTRVEGRNH